MSKYKVGDKFIIEIGHGTVDPLYGAKYSIKGFNTLVFDDIGLDRLEQYTGMTLRDAYDVGFEKGLKEGRNEKDCKACMDADAKANADYNAGYEDGLHDAWECAKAAVHDVNIYEVFGTIILRRVWDMNPSEAVAKLKEYEAKQAEIKVGDEVESRTHRKGIITYISGDELYVMWRDGSAGRNIREHFKKTGRHYDIDSILEQLKGADDENA